MTAPTTHTTPEQIAEQALRDAAAERGPLFLYRDQLALLELINSKLPAGMHCGSVSVSNYARHVVGRFGAEGQEPFEVVVQEHDLADHHHAWPAELAVDTLCENGCGLRYDQWQEPDQDRIAREHEEQLARDAEAAAAEAAEKHDDTPAETS